MSRTTLEDFIAPISRKLGHDIVPNIPTTVAKEVETPVRITDGLSQKALVDLFVEKAQGTKVSVVRTTEDGVATVVRRIIDDPPKLDDTIMAQVGPVVYEGTKTLEAYGVPQILDDDAVVWDATHGHDALMDACNDACFGITTAMGGIAEIGTIVQLTNPEVGRAISLLPLCHIAIVRAEDILPTFLDAVKVLEEMGGESGKNLPSSVNFISGVSATSDIELVRVEGVHGPMFVYYIVVE